MVEPPWLWIIAGPNGSGKSSAYSKATVDAPLGSIWIINPDELSKRILEQEGLGLDPANLEAVKRIETWLYASVEALQTVGVETVLSSPKYRRLVETAKAKGFRVRLIYVVLDKAERNIERVRIRVAKGGHAVAEDKIRDRRRRSLEQLTWFFEHVDEAAIYDNSGAEPVMLVSKTEEAVGVYGPLFEELVAALEPVVPGLRAMTAPKARRRRRRRRRHKPTVA